MSGTELTALQRQALEHIERARSEGKALSVYARDAGVSVRQIYDSARLLRDRGLLPARQRAVAAAGDFIAVQVAPPPTARPVCRLRCSTGLLIECLEWPPAPWLESVSARR